MTRRKLREATFMVLFQTEFRSDVSIDDTVRQYCSIEDENDNDDENGELPPVNLALAEREYIESVVTGVIDHKKEIDDIISGFAKGWTVERLIKVDLAVLRYAIYEMKYMSDKTPLEIIINEAVEIAKKYGTEKSKAFVNGVLSSCYKAMKGLA